MDVGEHWASARHGSQAGMMQGLGELAPFALDAELGPWWALDRRARIIAKADGTIVSSDHLARSLLRQRIGLFLREERLTTVDRKFQAMFDRQLKAPVGTRRCIVLPAGQEGTLLVQSICFACASGDAVALSARVIDDDLVPEYKGLAEAFDLTSAEDVVAQQLLRGLTPAEISAHCRLSIHTIRTHIAHVHAKLGVNSREAMWRRCGAFQVG